MQEEQPPSRGRMRLVALEIIISTAVQINQEQQESSLGGWQSRALPLSMTHTAQAAPEAQGWGTHTGLELQDGLESSWKVSGQTLLWVAQSSQTLL